MAGTAATVAVALGGIPRLRRRRARIHPTGNVVRLRPSRTRLSYVLAEGHWNRSRGSSSWYEDLRVAEFRFEDHAKAVAAARAYFAEVREINPEEIVSLELR